MGKIRVAVIGCGALAESAHLPNLLNTPNIEIVGICDTDEKRLNYAGDRFSLRRRYCDHKELLKELDFDAGVVCTTADAHADICVDLLDAGKDVFVEKPLALTSTDATRVLRKVRSTDRMLQVGYQMRFLENHRKAKKLAQTEIGEVYTGRIVADTLVIKVHETLLIDYMTHMFDLILWYFDEGVTRVGGMLYNEDQIQTGAQVSLTFSSGKIGSIEAFWVPKCSWGSVQRRIEILGSQGKIQTDITGPTVTLYKESSLLSKMRNPRTFMSTSSLNQYVPNTDIAYRDELHHFFECVRHRTKPICDAHDGLRALLIAEAAKESHLKNELVHLDGL